MAYTTLKKIISAIPICLDTENLQVVWSIFCREKCNELVVVNHQQQPLGLIYLHSLIPYIVSKSETQPLQTHTPIGNWQQPLSEVSSLILRTLRMLPADLTVDKLWPYLQAKSEKQINQESDISNLESPSSPIAVVDKEGKFLGLLDSLRVLEFIATNQEQKAKLRGKNCISESENSTETEQIVTKDLRTQGTVETSSYFSSLIELLEKLPLPLMLQSRDGKVINQNLAWHSQIKKESELREIVDTFISLSNIKQQPAEVKMPDSLAMMRDGVAFSCPATTNLRTSPTTLLQERAKLPKSNSASSSCYYTQADTYICTYPEKNGQERVWQFSSQPLFDLRLVLAQDVTEQHLVAKELQAKNADLIQLNRLKDEFLACISHELKTPLTSVLGLSSLLKEQTMGTLNERQARYAQLIHQSGRHLMAVVNDILDLTRMETGQMELNPEPVQIRQVCDRAFQEALQLQHKHPQGQSSALLFPDSMGAKYTLEIETGLNILIADELRLRQMLVNLLSNALKFTSADGKMGLKVARWERWIAFTVWDFGIGIPVDKQHLIFQKFQQLENPLSRQFEGTGLGLVLTQRLARLHGGDVTFISEENKGSEFTLILPPSPPLKDLGIEGWETNDYLREQGLIPSKQSVVPTRKDSKLPVNNYKLPVINYSSRLVLVVEGVPRFIEDLTNKLTGLGYRVVIARSGTEAVEKARKLQPKLIFLNPLLPLLSGWDVLTLLKTDPDTCQIPVIITATRGDKERGIINGANKFLSLPVEQSVLEQMLAEFTDSPSKKQVYQKLVILRLIPGKYEFQQPTTEDSIYEDKFLSLPIEYRVIEADDLAQANLLAKIWQPNVILIERVRNSVTPVEFIKKLSQYSNLAAIPLVTLDSETTQAANQVKQLSVFPCLAFEKNDRNLAEIELDYEYLTSALWQVISIAAGMSWQPTILVMDVANIKDFTLPLSDILSEETTVNYSYLTPEKVERDLGDNTFSAIFPTFISDLAVANQNWADSEQKKLPIDSTQVLVQYIETSGFRGLIGKSWVEVLQQLQNQSVDLLLICLQGKLPSGFDRALSHLEQIVTNTPILVLENSNYQLPKSLTPENLNLVLRKIATKILPSDLSIADLLEEIKHHLMSIVK